MRVLAAMGHFSTGVTVVPLLLGCTVDAFLPNTFTVGSFTSSLFENGVPTPTDLFLSRSSATIDVKMAGGTVQKGVILTALRSFIGFGLGLLLNASLGEAGFLRLAPPAVIGTVTNPNGVIYATLADEFGGETDIGATPILALNDGPFFIMIALNVFGMGNFPVTDVIASAIPMVIRFIIDSLGHEWRRILATGMVLLPPPNGFTLDTDMNFNNILRTGISSIVPGLLTVLTTGLLTFSLYNAPRGKADPMSVAIGTMAGVVTATPIAVAMIDPSLQPRVETATARTATAVATMAVLCPLLASWLSKVSRKWSEAHGMTADIPVPEQEDCETQPVAAVDLG